MLCVTVTVTVLGRLSVLVEVPDETVESGSVLRKFCSAKGSKLTESTGESYEVALGIGPTVVVDIAPRDAVTVAGVFTASYVKSGCP